MPELSPRRIAFALEELAFETTILRNVVGCLLAGSSPQARESAIALIRAAAGDPLRFVFDKAMDEEARHNLTKLASDWTLRLSF